ncbi:hypothetical protein ACRRTK_003705 [Alexandromys fortis]
MKPASVLRQIVVISVPGGAGLARTRWPGVGASAPGRSSRREVVRHWCAARRRLSSGRVNVLRETSVLSRRGRARCAHARTVQRLRRLPLGTHAERTSCI